MTAQITISSPSSGRKFYPADRVSQGIVKGLPIVSGALLAWVSLNNLQVRQMLYQNCLDDVHRVLGPTVVVVSCENRAVGPIVPWVIAAMVIAVLCVALGVVSLVFALRAGLRISPEGIDFSYDFYHFRTTWDNVDKAATQADFGDKTLVTPIRHNIECLSLRDPAVDRGGLLTLRASDTLRRLIPLSLYSPTWRDGEIGQEIRKYAPQVLG